MGSLRTWKNPIGSRCPNTCFKEQTGSFWMDGSFKNGTLSPIIIEVESGGLEDDWLVSKGAIFDFHDYGRKGRTRKPTYQKMVGWTSKAAAKYKID